MTGLNVARCLVNLHRVAILAAMQQKRIAPKPPNLFFVCRPVRDMPSKNEPECGIRPNARIELRHDTVYLCFSNRNARWDSHTTTIHTRVRLTTK
jgi:hypothetical protein